MKTSRIAFVDELTDELRKGMKAAGRKLDTLDALGENMDRLITRFEAAVDRFESAADRITPPAPVDVAALPADDQLAAWCQPIFRA